MDFYNRNGEPIDRDEWAKLFTDREYQTLRGDEFETSDGYRGFVSTIWLGMDHSLGDDGPPLIFETMVFFDSDGPDDYDFQRRYSTELEAFEGHAMIMKAIGGAG